MRTRATHERSQIPASKDKEMTNQVLLIWYLNSEIEEGQPGSLNEHDHLSHRRLDVLIKMKDVRWILAVFDAHKPLIIQAITGPHASFALIYQEVDIDTFTGKRLDRLLEAV